MNLAVGCFLRMYHPLYHPLYHQMYHFTTTSASTCNVQTRVRLTFEKQILYKYCTKHVWVTFVNLWLGDLEETR